MSSDDSTISYDYSQCQTVYEDLVNDQATIATQMAGLEQTINNLRATWSGLSARQWNQIQSQWNAALETMTGDLKAAATTLPEMAAAMQRADHSAAIRIASIGQ
jgi:WXG100 family type VII secretion target